MKKYGIIGYPLTHSFSQAYFNQKFKELGLEDCVFEMYEIDDISKIKDLLLQNPELKGFCVTIPYKEAIIPYLNEIDPQAKEIGAVNSVVVNQDGTLKGYNTDVTGFMISLKSGIGQLPEKSLVLGSGGASKAVCYALSRLGIEYKMVSRKSSVDSFTYTDLTPEIIAEYKLIINTTPLGTFPNNDACPDIHYSAIGNDHYVHDLVYNPSETKFLQLSRKTGARIKNGYHMLVEQAECNWKLWHK